MTTHTTMRWRIPVWAWLPIALAIAAEAAWNALRAYSLGRHVDGYTVAASLWRGEIDVSLAGVVLVLAALAVSLSQARAAWTTLRPGPLRQRIVSGFAAVLLLTVSLSSGISHLLEANRAKVADSSGERTAYDDKRAEYERKAAELAALGTPRPVDVVQADVQSIRIDAAIWRRSAQCADISRDDTRDACRPVLALYKERGAAARKAELAPEVEALRVELATMKRPAPEAAPESWANIVSAWAMVFAIAALATFGPVIFAVPVAPKPSPGAPRSLDASPPPRGRRPTLVHDETHDDRKLAVVDALHRVGGSVSSNRELAEIMQCSEGEATRRVGFAHADGLVVFERIGKEKMIALAADQNVAAAG